MSDTSRTEVARYRELDALRGLAAISVFLSHAFGLLSAPALLPLVRSFGLRALSDGAAAVDLFFVLSGFVLAKSLFATAIDYRTFLIRRVFRIYPAYWASLLFALFAERYLLDRQALAALAPFGAAALAGAVDWQQILYHMLMIMPGTFDQERINPVIWTIVIVDAGGDHISRADLALFSAPKALVVSGPAGSQPESWACCLINRARWVF